MDQIEAIRASHRPLKITTLFVGESAPVSGDFFYSRETQMLRNMRTAVERTYGKTENFLRTFKQYGWYLDDLVLEPINDLKQKKERETKWWEAKGSLATRIKEYRPEAIVTLLLGMTHVVSEAAREAGFSGRLHTVPFPGNGQQKRFAIKMAEILPELPRLK